jgi:hypothetical protein
MDQDPQKPAEASSEPDVAKPLEEADLDVVTGGLASVAGAALRTDPACVTAGG